MVFLFLLAAATFFANLINIIILSQERVFSKCLKHMIIPSTICILSGISFFLLLSKDTNDIIMFVLVYLYVITAITNVISGGIYLFKSLIYKEYSFILENIAFIILSVVALPVVIILALLFSICLKLFKQERNTYSSINYTYF